MFKTFLKVILVVLIVLISFKTTYAILDKPFGGKITNNKATEIENAENEGYTCMVLGSTITINPVSFIYPKTYFISFSTLFKSFSSTGEGKQILGLYSPIKKTITCSKSCPPPPWKMCYRQVTLDTINLFGTSKQ